MRLNKVSQLILSAMGPDSQDNCADPLALHDSNSEHLPNCEVAAFVGSIT